MLTRILSLTVAGVIVVGILLIVTWALVGDNNGAPERKIGGNTTRTPMTVALESFQGRTDRWIVSGQIAEAASAAIEVQLDVRDTEGRPAPAELQIGLLFDMQGHSMPLIENLERVGEGRYRARATLPMSGAWQVLVSLPDGTVKTAIDGAGQQ